MRAVRVTTGGPTFLHLPERKIKPEKHSGSVTNIVLYIHIEPWLYVDKKSNAEDKPSE